MDRRVVLAIVLMMAIAMLPALLVRPRPGLPAAVDTVEVAGPPPPAPPPAPVGPVVEPDEPVVERPEVRIPVSGPLYRYELSTRGGRLTGATMLRYRSMAPADGAAPAQILAPASDLLGLRLVVAGDTVVVHDWDLVPSSEAVLVDAPASLTLSGARGGHTVDLTYRFQPDNYVIAVEGRIAGLGPAGGTLLIGMGPGLRNTESDSVEHLRELAVVTKAADTEKKPFSGLSRERPTELPGPFDWVAVKSKYFVTAIFAVDTGEVSTVPRLAGVRAVPTDTRRRPGEADVQASLPLTAAGQFRFTVYAGPMEYPRLRAMGHAFYDVNPYGWAAFRTIIRPVAVAGRWLLVKMHELGLPYGLGLIVFGIGIRILLWPLNQKAMRAGMQMQAIQPLMKDLQERYKDDQQRLQQEMFKLYKEHKVNPLGGCWPMLLPFPILIALFFVFQNTIELRGAPFLWLNDLSRPDPFYVIPVLMGLSMYLVTRIGQMGMAPNPQMKIMLYLMPVMLTVLFFNFASGLNLYYAVQNLASVPQQWLLAQERMRKAPPQAPPKAPASPKPAAPPEGSAPRPRKGKGRR
jgi:YidC/Oxa1 family membrane protein insertase